MAVKKPILSKINRKKKEKDHQIAKKFYICVELHKSYYERPLINMNGFKKIDDK